MSVVDDAEQALWASEGARARAYLHQRGLNETTIKKYRLGYSPAWRTVAEMRVPHGIVIPWIAADNLSLVKVRTPSNEPGRKYVSVRWEDTDRARDDGGHPCLFGADNLTGSCTAALTEGEFDCMLLDQEAGNLLDVATLGSIDAPVPDDAVPLLLPAARVLLLYDDDDGGQRAMARLSGRYGGMSAVAVPEGDITDYWRAGGALRDLVQPHLAAESVGARTVSPPVAAPDLDATGDPHAEGVAWRNSVG